MVQRVVVFAFGVVTRRTRIRAATGWCLLPQENSGQVTAVGCLVRGIAVRGGKKDKYALARPKNGPVASVPEASCTADAGADALTVDNPEKGKITDAMLGRWVEISGRLESETSKDPDNLRELDVADVQDGAGRPPGSTGTADAVTGGGTGTAARGQRSRRHPQPRQPQRQPQRIISCRRRRVSFQR